MRVLAACGILFLVTRARLLDFFLKILIALASKLVLSGDFLNFLFQLLLVLLILCALVLALLHFLLLVELLLNIFHDLILDLLLHVALVLRTQLVHEVFLRLVVRLTVLVQIVIQLLLVLQFGQTLLLLLILILDIVLVFLFDILKLPEHLLEHASPGHSIIWLQVYDSIFYPGCGACAFRRNQNITREI